MIEKTVEEITTILHKYLDEVQIDDRQPNAPLLRLLLQGSSVRRDAYSWKATVYPSRTPRRWTYLYEEVGVITEELLAKAGLNVFFEVGEPLVSETDTISAGV